MSKPSKLTRALALAAMLAATNLAGATAAQAHATDLHAAKAAGYQISRPGCPVSCRTGGMT